MRTNELVAFEDLATKNVTVKELPYIFVTKFEDSAVIDFYKQFLEMEADPKVKIIPVVVSSYGGQIHALLSMLDVIASSTKPVATVGLGKAMSCGAVLLAAGTKGYRYASENTDIMIHEAWSIEVGKASELQNGVKSTKRLNDLLFTFLSVKAGKKDKNYILKQVKKRGNLDWFISAQQYKSMGLIDHVGVPKFIKK